MCPEQARSGFSASEEDGHSLASLPERTLRSARLAALLTTFREVTSYLTMKTIKPAPFGPERVGFASHKNSELRRLFMRHVGTKILKRR